LFDYAQIITWFVDPDVNTDISKIHPSRLNPTVCHTPSHITVHASFT